MAYSLQSVTEQYMKEVKKIFPEAKAGKDGMSVDLMFEE